MMEDIRLQAPGIPSNNAHGTARTARAASTGTGHPRSPRTWRKSVGFPAGMSIY